MTAARRKRDLSDKLGEAQLDLMDSLDLAGVAMSRRALAADTGRAYHALKAPLTALTRRGLLARSGPGYRLTDDGAARLKRERELGRVHTTRLRPRTTAGTRVREVVEARKVITSSQLQEALPDLPTPTLYTAIGQLVTGGLVKRVAHGVYLYPLHLEEHLQPFPNPNEDRTCNR